MIRKVEIKDCNSIAEIYNYYIEHTIITFEETPINTSEMEKRVNEIYKNFPFLVYEENDEILGFAYVDKFQSRCAYRFTLENSIYLKTGYEGRGIGKILLNELLNAVRKTDTHSIIAKIALPNERSIKLHEKYGFKNVGILKEVGYKFDKWIDVGYWELLL